MRLSSQEYFVRQKDGCILDEESEKRKLTRCLIAAIKRRVSNVLLIHTLISLYIDVNT